MIGGTEPVVTWDANEECRRRSRVGERMDEMHGRISSGGFDMHVSDCGLPRALN